MESFEVVATFSSEFEAELAQATLAAAGIQSALKQDDAGGMLTALLQKDGVRVVVAPENAAEARKVLSESAHNLPEP
jgi:hypothetical protein